MVTQEEMNQQQRQALKRKGVDHELHKLVADNGLPGHHMLQAQRNELRQHHPAHQRGQQCHHRFKFPWSFRQHRPEYL